MKIVLKDALTNAVLILLLFTIGLWLFNEFIDIVDQYGTKPTLQTATYSERYVHEMTKASEAEIQRLENALAQCQQ